MKEKEKEREKEWKRERQREIRVFGWGKESERYREKLREFVDWEKRVKEREIERKRER